MKKIIILIITLSLAISLFAINTSAATRTKYLLNTGNRNIITVEDAKKAADYANSMVGKSTITGAYNQNWGNYDFESRYNCAQFVRSCYWGRTNTPYTSAKDPTYWSRSDVWGIVSASKKNIPVGALCIWEGYVCDLDRNTGHVAIVVGADSSGEAIIVGAGDSSVTKMKVSEYTKSHRNMLYKGWTSYLGYSMELAKKPVPKIKTTNVGFTKKFSVSCADATQLQVVLVEKKTMKSTSYTYRKSSINFSLPKSAKYTVNVRAKLSDGSWSEYSSVRLF